MRESTKENPLTQAEVLNYVKTHKAEIFEVAKVAIDVELTKAAEPGTCLTTTLARDGRKIDETVNNYQEGFAIDTRHCINGDLDQYAKKPARVAGSYELDGGRAWEDVAPGETVKATTIGGEHRQAFVADKTLFIATEWGEIQEVGTGGIVTISGNEAIGNNNPCDMVLVVDGKQSDVVMTKPVYEQRKDLEAKGAKLTPAVEKFFKVAAAEDRKNPYMNDMSKTHGKGNGIEK